MNNKKYISRIDQSTINYNGTLQETHCWIVRLFMVTPYQIYKTFTDSRYNNKLLALKAAIKYRDKMLLKFKAVIRQYRKKVLIKIKKEATYDKLKRWPYFRSKGYIVITRARDNRKIYTAIEARVPNRYNKSIIYKYFKFTDKIEQLKAKKKAAIWVKKERNKVFIMARSLGLNPGLVGRLTIKDKQ